MSSPSINSDDSEASTVWHSCREGDTSASETDIASFKSFSSRSISTLNSYQSALSYLSSGTSHSGYMSALDVDEDAQTLQGDEFGGELEYDDPIGRESESSTPTPMAIEVNARQKRLSGSSQSSTDTLENEAIPETLAFTDNVVTFETEPTLE